MAKRKRKNKKKSNGFFYIVTDEQIKQHQQRSMDEIFQWIEKTHKFIYEMQTPREREISRKIREGKF